MHLFFSVCASLCLWFRVYKYGFVVFEYKCAPVFIGVYKFVVFSAYLK